MSWIKRNLYFVAGGAVALILMGLAGFYLYSKWQLNNEIMETLNTDYEALQRLNSENPHPGSGSVDNITEAQAQQRQMQEFAAKLRKFYQPIDPIPYDAESPKVSDRDFSAALSRTIYQLQHDAESTSVSLPPSYSFSFEAQRPRVTFAAGSPTLLAVQLGDIKAICDVLIKAKVNSIDNIRRERVSADDYNGPHTDYTDQKSVTNELAVLTPYEVTFRCFSSELASVLGAFSISPNAIMVKSINVEPGLGTNVFDQFGGGMASPYPGMGMPYPGAQPGGPEAEMFNRRYGGAGRMPQGAENMAGMPGMPGAGRLGGGVVGGGLGGGGMPGGGLTGGGVPLRGLGEAAQVAPRQTYAYPPAAAASGGAPRPGALQTVLDEKQMKVTMQLVIVKLLPANPRK